MKYIYKNITGNTATDLELYDDYTGEYTNMLLCNVHVSDAVTVDLYITKTVSNDDRFSVGENGNWDPLSTMDFTYYILKTVNIPLGATLSLDHNDLIFDSTEYDLYIKLNAADSAVDITLYKTN